MATRNRTSGSGLGSSRTDRRGGLPLPARAAAIAFAVVLALGAVPASAADESLAPAGRADRPAGAAAPDAKPGADAAPASPVEPAVPPAPAVTASADDIRAAEIKVRQAEIDYLQAKIELVQLTGKEAEAAKLQEQADAAAAALGVLNAAQAEAEGFIRKWLVLGPVPVDEKVAAHDEESCKAMLDRAYVPANAAPRDGEKVAIDGSDLAWKSAEAADFFVDLSKVAEDAGKEPEKAAYLGVVYVTSAAEATGVKLAIGSDDDSVWRLNGQEVFRVYEGRAVDKDQNTAENLTLKKGRNVLSFTVLNGDGPAAAAARFLDSEGNPLKGLTVSLTPPEK